MPGPSFARQTWRAKHIRAQLTQRSNHENPDDGVERNSAVHALLRTVDSNTLSAILNEPLQPNGQEVVSQYQLGRLIERLLRFYTNLSVQPELGENSTATVSADVTVCTLLASLLRCTWGMDLWCTNDVKVWPTLDEYLEHVIQEANGKEKVWELSLFDAHMLLFLLYHENELNISLHAAEHREQMKQPYTKPCTQIWFFPSQKLNEVLCLHTDMHIRGMHLYFSSNKSIEKHRQIDYKQCLIDVKINNTHYLELNADWNNKLYKIYVLENKRSRQERGNPEDQQTTQDNLLDCARIYRLLDLE